MPIYFEWTEDMSVGEKTIDVQHQKLLSQVNKIIDSMVFGGGSREATEALDFMSTYVDEHFLYEEAYMNRRGYLDAEAHKIQHQNFVKKYAELKQRMQNDHLGEKLLLEIEQFLGKWWLEHIGHEDKKYYKALSSTLTS